MADIHALLSTNIGLDHPTGFLGSLRDALRERLLRSSRGLASSSVVSTPSAFVDVPVVDGGSVVTWVKEGDEIPQSAPNTRTVRVIPGRALGLVPISVRAIEAGEVDLVQMVTRDLAREMVKAVDASFYNSTAAPGPTGGLGSIESPTTVEATGGIKSLDPIIEAAGLIEAADFTPTDLHISPDLLVGLRLLKDRTDSSRPLIEPDVARVAGAEANADAVPVLAGLNLRVSSQLPAGTAWVTAKERVVGTLNGSTKFDTSADAFFSRELIAVRASQSIGWAITDKAAAVKITTTA